MMKTEFCTLEVGKGGEFIDIDETKFRTSKGGQDLLKERKLNLGLVSGGLSVPPPFQVLN